MYIFTIDRGEKMIQYIITNKEWIFSGIGVAAISWFLIRNKSSKTTNKNMRQKGGDNSTNIQVGGDVKNSFRDNDRGN